MYAVIDHHNYSCGRTLVYQLSQTILSMRWSGDKTRPCPFSCSKLPDNLRARIMCDTGLDGWKHHTELSCMYSTGHQQGKGVLHYLYALNTLTYTLCAFSLFGVTLCTCTTNAVACVFAYNIICIHV